MVVLKMSEAGFQPKLGGTTDAVADSIRPNRDECCFVFNTSKRSEHVSHNIPPTLKDFFLLFSIDDSTFHFI